MVLEQTGGMEVREENKKFNTKLEMNSELSKSKDDSAYSSTYSSSLNCVQLQGQSSNPTVNLCEGSKLKNLPLEDGEFRNPTSLTLGSNSPPKGVQISVERNHEPTENFEEPDSPLKTGHDIKAKSVNSLPIKKESEKIFSKSSLNRPESNSAEGLNFNNFKKLPFINNDKTTLDSELKSLTTHLPKTTTPSSDVHKHSEGLATDKDSSQVGFCVAVSFLNGEVMHTTSSLTELLGFPKDMWIGRSFIDFLHKEDHETFLAHVMKNISQSVKDMSEENEVKATNESFFCRIRLYNGLKFGFLIKERKTRYNPFKLSICFSEVDRATTDSSQQTEASNRVIYLFITAIPVVSAYLTPLQVEPIKLSTGQLGFTSKHDKYCKYTWLDSSYIAYTGNLPQQMIGEDIFSCIHPGDLEIIREVFIEVMKEIGKPCMGKPFRMRIKNGCFITVRSWWSAFINPWSRQLEFIHGKHTVIQGPENVDVINCDNKVEEMPALTEEDEAIISDIRTILSTNNKTTRSIDQYPLFPSSTNKKKLASFMGSLLEEVTKAENHKMGGGSTKALLVGNVSTHHSDSSDSPPSYNQLSYNENLARFFNSQPQTLTLSEKETQDPNDGTNQYQNNSYTKDNKDRQCKQRSVTPSGMKTSRNGSGSSKQQQESRSAEGTGQNSSTLPNGMSVGQAQQGGDDGIYSQDGSGSGSRLWSGSRNSEIYKGPPITEELMAEHNKDMEKRMLFQFKEAKRAGEVMFHKKTVKQNNAQTTESKKVVLSKVEGNFQNKSENVQTTTRRIETHVTENKHPMNRNESDQSRKMSQTDWLAHMDQQVKGNRPVNINININISKQSGPDNQTGLNYNTTSSSSLYSFLKTSSDEKTAEESGEEEKLKVKKVIKQMPALKEPFWNLRVGWNDDLKYKFTMPQTDLEEVLSADKEKMKSMIQPGAVNEQLKSLAQDCDEGIEMSDFLFPMDDEIETEDDQVNPEEHKIIQKRRDQEKLSMFLDAEVPFPVPDTFSGKQSFPSHHTSTSRQMFCTSRTGSSLTGSSEDSFNAFKAPNKKFRFGQMSSLSGERSEYRTEEEMNEKVDASVMADILPAKLDVVDADVIPDIPEPVKLNVKEDAGVTADKHPVRLDLEVDAVDVKTNLNPAKSDVKEDVVDVNVTDIAPVKLDVEEDVKEKKDLMMKKDDVDVLQKESSVESEKA